MLWTQRLAGLQARSKLEVLNCTTGYHVSSQTWMHRSFILKDSCFLKASKERLLSYSLQSKGNILSILNHN